MNNTPIDKLYEDFNNLKNFLLENKELDYLIKIDNNFKKNLLISSASYIENELRRILINFIESNSNQIITHFLTNKAITRQYHTYFDWKANNINSFLGLFGDDFRENVKQKIKNNNLEKNVKAFLELGRLRNELVHENFIEYKLEKTADEIKELFDSANEVIKLLEIEFSEN